MDRKEAIGWLGSQPDFIRTNIEMFEDSRRLYRIDHKEQNGFKPRVPLTPQKNENNTIPRVCCSFSFWDAIVGYDPERLLHQPGNHFVHQVDHDVYFVPNSKLTPFAELSREVWVVEKSNKVKLKKVASFQAKKVKGVFYFSIQSSITKLALNETISIDKGDFILEVSPVDETFAVRKSLLKIENANKIIDWK